jgi:hypothetical protein
MITAGLVALLVGIFIYQVAYYGYSANMAFSKLLMSIPMKVCLL